MNLLFLTFKGQKSPHLEDVRVTGGVNRITRHTTDTV